jgi:hypothetical protein
VAHEAGWESAKHPGKWVAITRTFRDGSTQQWWALEIVAGPYGPDKTERSVVATTDPQTLPDLTTWYLVTNLPAPTTCPVAPQPFAQASLEEVIRLYGLRMWVEQSYKQVKHALGWSQYQVRSDQAIRRHWQLVCCAFSFCWYHSSHPCSSVTAEERVLSEPDVLLHTNVPAPAVGTREKIGEQSRGRPLVSWPVALRAVRGWLEPWIMLRRYWRAWSELPPPPLLQCLFEQLGCGQRLFLYDTF